MTETFAAPFPADVDAAASRVLARACAAGLTVATAESCTGGLVAAVLTDVEGCSHAVVAGLVTYTDDAKTALLGVDAGLIAREGAVSAPVAVAMAEGALARTGADVALAVTGFAGPAGPDDEPGLVHLAAARTGRPTLHVERHYGDIGRGRVRMACLRTLLDLLDARLD